METYSTDLTILGLNTDTPQYFWKGKRLEGVVSFTATNKEGPDKVTFTMSEDPVFAEMKVAGITIYRV